MATKPSSASRRAGPSTDSLLPPNPCASRTAGTGSGVSGRYSRASMSTVPGLPGPAGSCSVTSSVVICPRDDRSPVSAPTAARPTTTRITAAATSGARGRVPGRRMRMRINVGEAGVVCGRPDAARLFQPDRHTWKNWNMTERKPPDVTFETWIDRQIRMAQERGDFDNLPGAGKPLTGLGDVDDELWWVRRYLHREGLPTDALLPTPLQLRREIERLPDTVRDLPSEQAVRDVVAELNLRIVAWLRAPTGPQVPVGRVNAEHVVARWR